MIQININQSYPYSCQIKGHADYGPHGQDLLCAGVSAISQGILLGLVDIADDYMDYEINEGFLSFYFHSPMESTIELKVESLMHTLWLSLINIQQQYPEHITIKEEV